MEEISGNCSLKMPPLKPTLVTQAAKASGKPTATPKERERDLLLRQVRTEMPEG